MITICVHYNESFYSVEVKGHSGYDVIGKDIVCSAISTAMTMTVNLLEKLKIKFQFNADEKIPLMDLKIENCSSNDVSEAIFDNLIDTCKGISEQYSKYLKINEIRR